MSASCPLRRSPRESPYNSWVRCERWREVVSNERWSCGASEGGGKRGMGAHPALRDDNGQLGLAVRADGNVLDLADGQHAIDHLRQVAGGGSREWSRADQRVCPPAVVEARRTLPNTTCLLSSQSQASHVRKNWQPFVLAPELAMESRPGPVCLRSKFSSSNLSPCTEMQPVPSPLTKSPP